MSTSISDKLLILKALDKPLFNETERIRFLSKPFERLADQIAFETPLHTWGTVCDYLGEGRRSSYRIPKGSHVPMGDVSKTAFYSCEITSKRTGQTIQVHLVREPVDRFEADAVINAANEVLLGGGGVDGRLHTGAGPNLVKECALHDGCEIGEAVITKGYDLPEKYVLHTVAPLLKSNGKGDSEALKACYDSCLSLCDEFRLKSVVVPCVGCGFYAFPLDESARVVKEVLQNYVDRGLSNVDTVILSLRKPTEVKAYLEAFKMKTEEKG